MKIFGNLLLVEYFGSKLHEVTHGVIETYMSWHQCCVHIHSSYIYHRQCMTLASDTIANKTRTKNQVHLYIIQRSEQTMGWMTKPSELDS